MTTDDTPEATNSPAKPFLDGYTAIEDTRLGRKSKAALYLMAEEGLTAIEAAKRVGIRPNNFTRTFNRPEIRAAYNQLLKEIRDNAAQLAYLRINHMGKSANSEHVRLDANKWVAGVDGISPVQKVEGRHLHKVQFGGFDYGDSPLDVTPEDTESPDDAS